MFDNKPVAITLHYLSFFPNVFELICLTTGPYQKLITSDVFLIVKPLENINLLHSRVFKQDQPAQRDTNYSGNVEHMTE